MSGIFRKRWQRKNKPRKAVVKSVAAAAPTGGGGGKFAKGPINSGLINEGPVQ